MANKNHSDFINFRELFSTYLSKWYLFVISVIVFGILGYLYSRTQNPVYGVRANVLIQEQSNSLLSNMGGLGDLFGSGAKVDDEIFVITSHSIYRDVARDLGINKRHIVRTGFLQHELAYPDFPVDVTAPDALTDTLTSTLAFKIKVSDDGIADIVVKSKGKEIAELEDAKLPANVDTPYGQFTVSKTATYPEGESVKTTIAYSSYNGAAELLAEDIFSDIPSRKGNVISLGMDTDNPAYGTAVLNDIIRLYNAHGIDESNTQATKTLNFIKERLDLLVKDLSESEAEIQKFKEGNNVFALEVELKYQTEKRGKIEESLLAAQTNAEVIKMTLDYIRRPGNEYTLIPVAVENEGVRSAIEGYNELILRRLELAEHSKGNNAALKQIERQIDAVRNNVAKSVETAYNNAVIAVDEIKNEKNSTDSRLGALPTQEREYIDLMREREIKQQLYLFLLQRQEETSILLANALPKGVVVDEAYTLSKPLNMGTKGIVAIFVILGLLATPVYLYLRKIIRNRFDTRSEVESAISVPILGEMCADRSGKSLVVTSKEHTSSSELFRLIRSNLLFMLNNADDKVVLMTSSTSGEGKSFISINLAASLAMLGKKVLLVGMDIRKPRLAEYLDLNTQFGLTQYLSSGTISLEQIINKVPDVPGLDIITSGPVPPNPAELLASEKVDEMFARLRDDYDYIIVDTAPVGLVSDTFTLARISDATIYVCRVNYTPMSDLRFIEDVYTEKRLKKLSVIVNGTTSKKAYGYGYGHEVKG